MQATDIKKIACIGAGTIGASWASYYLWKGYPVTVQDLTKEALSRARSLIKNNLTFLVDKGLLTENELTFTKISVNYTTDIGEAVKDVQFIQESAFEDYEVKKTLFREIDEDAPEAIFATSSSGLLISEIQKASRFPARCLTAHPFNPPHLIPLVELVKGQATGEETFNLAYDFYKLIGKVPVRVNKEVPGHIANRIAFAYWRECIDLVMNGVCSVEDLDLASCYGPGPRYALMGPHLIYHLGGGPGGIRDFINHLGPSAEMWWDDMATWKRFPEGCKDVLEKGVQEELAGRTAQELAAWRDEKLVELLKGLGRL